ncbi:MULTISPECIES: hypothetical protein [Streptomyces]|uniref:Uncharacterized protein n=1 Tax=Streptomyces griseosporeus TaxID=1910 RepID=A0ABV3KUA5_STRGS|nr:hypothetical protein [Streptomyces actuosus]MBM4819793.1 hypothetical protein [Streptomyces actuosus]
MTTDLARAPLTSFSPTESKPPRTVLRRFPAGGPRGSWPAEEFAQQQRRDGVAAEVVMDLASDSFLVVVA